MSTSRQLGAVALLLLGDPARAGEPLTVLAASSLTESLQELATAWTATGRPEVVFSFDASSRLARQVEAGAPADLFISADAAWMDWLAERSLVDRTTRVDLAGNALVVVVPAGSALRVAAAGDLARPEVRHLALAGESVPAGRYAQAALTSLAAWDAVSARVVRADDVRAALAWVARGQADAGIVYRTDAAVEPGVVVAWTLPASSHPPVVYPAAVVAASDQAALAAELLAFCRSERGSDVFRAAGFAPPPGPAR